MASKSQRPRDEHGRFLPKEQAEEAAGAEDAEGAEAAGAEASTDSGAAADDAEVVDISDTVAPSVGPHTTVTRRPHSEHGQSDVDAMGLDKRREVVGQSYAPSFGRQAAMYGIFLAVLAALVIGGKLLADELDQPPAEVKDQAVWTGNEIAPTDIDFRPTGDISTQTSGP